MVVPGSRRQARISFRWAARQNAYIGTAGEGGAAWQCRHTDWCARGCRRALACLGRVCRGDTCAAFLARNPWRLRFDNQRHMPCGGARVAFARMGCFSIRAGEMHALYGLFTKFGWRHSGVAQWLACWAHNPKVRGSKPRSATFSQLFNDIAAFLAFTHEMLRRRVIAPPLPEFDDLGTSHCVEGCICLCSCASTPRFSIICVATVARRPALAPEP